MTGQGQTGLPLELDSKEVQEMAKEITFEVRCIGCNELVTPQEVDWELFRLGVHVHDSDGCRDKAEEKFQKMSGIVESVWGI